jgi:hypothetical protein
MKYRSFFQRGLSWAKVGWLLVSLTGLAGCAWQPAQVDLSAPVNAPVEPGTPGMRYGLASHWYGDHLTGPPSILIRLSAQRAYFYKGTQLAGISVISPGREGYHTPMGRFKIVQKDRNHRSTLYGDYRDAAGNIIQKDVDTSKHPKPPGAIYVGAPMPFFMRITGGVGLHEGYLPGYPASHGCIRMPGFMAEAFFNAVEVGTLVVIEP